MYGCETRSLAIRSVNNVMMSIFGPNRDRTSGGYNVQPCSTINTIRVIKKEGQQGM
jgi:hypothetical protein